MQHRFQNITCRLTLTFDLQVEPEEQAAEGEEAAYEVVEIESQSEIDRKRHNLTLSLSPNKLHHEPIQTPQDEESGKSKSLHDALILLMLRPP